MASPSAAADVGVEDDGPLDEGDDGADDGGDTADSPDVQAVVPDEVMLLVTLDGEPSPDTDVRQGGVEGAVYTTGADGRVLIPVVHNLRDEGQLALIASHPEARVRGIEVRAGDTALQIDLVRFDPSDNEDYIFPDPGEPTRRPNTNQCAHCHQTINEAWFESPHRDAARNPIVQDLYAGTGSGRLTEDQCQSGGGQWAVGRVPGGGEEGERCYFGEGLLHTLNPSCGDGPCDDAQHFGDCANCHAPGINGRLGGRDLLEAEGIEYEYGVHCTICHATDSVDMDAAPGVAGRLGILRPSEPAAVSLGAGGFFPLTFGPHHDSPNPRMGSVQRQHFHDGKICGACHQQDMAVQVDGGEIDMERWPEGRLPVHSTFKEHKTGALGEATRCPSCHMPPDPQVLNTADLQRFPDAKVGFQGGWWRPPGAVRAHSWVGPRAVDSGMLQLAAALRVDAWAEGDELVAEVTVRNVAAGHAIPTGEPSRSMLMTVSASCGDESLSPTGGDVVPVFGGFAARRVRGDDLDRWPEAMPGDRLRAVRRDGTFHDYEGFGAFGDRFSAEDKGMPAEFFAGEVLIESVSEDGEVTLDAELPDADVVYLVRTQVGLPDLAGAPGYGFARVMVGVDGAVMVPHFRAVDVMSDNRLLPQKEWTSTHRFAGGCEAPVVTAELWYRRLPGDWVRERGWDVADVKMARATARAQPELIERVDPEPTGNVVEMELTAAAVDHPHYLYAYNGMNPGPVIRAELGDVLRVTFHNDLDIGTTIHWHGMKVPFAMDGVTWMADPVMPGEVFVYEFPLVHAGTFWYHPHFDTERQVDGGLFGALIVVDPREPATAQDLVFVLDALDEVQEGHEEHEHDDAAASEDHAGGHGAVARQWYVNGQAAPLEVRLTGGSVTRARFINVSNVSYAKLEGPPLRQIAADQGLLPAMLTPESVLLGPADRAEFEWLVGEEGFSLWTAPYTLNGGDTLGAPVELVRVVVDDPAPAPVSPAYPFSGALPTSDPSYTDIVYAFSGSDRYGAWLINGEEFPDTTVREVGLGTAPVVEVRNLSPTEHPFHIHGVHFEVLSVNGVPPEVRRIEDNWNLKIRDVLRVRLLADNPGDWMIHCHILPHAHQGLMTVLRIR
jgi:FtsP/CotA-like multicopper oxidase with cupredoxin domain